MNVRNTPADFSPLLRAAAGMEWTTPRYRLVWQDADRTWRAEMARWAADARAERERTEDDDEDDDGATPGERHVVRWARMARYLLVAMRPRGAFRLTDEDRAQIEQLRADHPTVIAVMQAASAVLGPARE